MSNEQSIRDELADVLADSYMVFSDDAIDLADEILASPVIRRIQAEAWGEGHAQALANVAWPKERKGNPYIERGETA